MSIKNLTDHERELAAEVVRLRTDAQVMGLALVERDAEIERQRAECAAIEEQAVKNCDEVLALRANVQVLRDACQAVDDLIEYQYTGTREGMTALQVVSDQCRVALEDTKEPTP